MILKIFTDGGSKGNPGPSSIGIVFYAGDKKVFQHKENIGIATNNDAEYIALIKALENIKDKISKIKNTYQISKIFFYSDSRLLINQVKGLFKVKNGKIREYIFKIRTLEQEIKIPINYYLISREENWEADRLVNNF